jgi:hypothetical protein
MKPTRPQTPEGMARSITPNKAGHLHPDIPVKPGMVRQTTGDLHPWLHGIETQDEPNTVKDFTKAIPLHSANPLGPDKLAEHETAASRVLTDAANLGRGQKA